MKISMLENNDFLVDLSYIYLVVALIEIAEEAENNNLEGVIVSGEKSEYDEKISYRLKKLKKRLISAMVRYKKYSNEINPLREKLLINAIKYSSDVLQPDYLAIYMLRFRFIRSKREICEEFKWLSKKGSELVSILELLDLTSIGSSEDEMCELAYKIVRDL